MTEDVMKRPTVNKSSFDQKFKDNNYNNNEEALLDYDDGVSIAMIKKFQESKYFPSNAELSAYFEENASHNKALLDGFAKFESEESKKDEHFAYQSNIVNNLMPITRWHKESVRYGNGVALEGVWMLCPSLYCALGKINYRDESFTMIVNSMAKWPLAYRKMYQTNRTVSLDGKRGRNLAGDEWVEGHLVRPVKQYSSSQTNFTMLELMSCNQGGLAATSDLAAFGLYMIALVKKSVNHSKTLTSMREVQRSLARLLENMFFFVRDDSIVEKEFVFCYCLFALTIFGDSTAFGHHISQNSGSVYTPAVYYVKNMNVMVVLSKT